MDELGRGSRSGNILKSRADVGFHRCGVNRFYQTEFIGELTDERWDWEITRIVKLEMRHLCSLTFPDCSGGGVEDT